MQAVFGTGFSAAVYNNNKTTFEPPSDSALKSGFYRQREATKKLVKFHTMLPDKNGDQAFFFFLQVKGGLTYSTTQGACSTAAQATPRKSQLLPHKICHHYCSMRFFLLSKNAQFFVRIILISPRNI